MSASAAASPGPSKIDPETLVLRGTPRPVTRFKRHFVIGIAAIVVIAVFAAGWLALSAPPLRAAIKGNELYNTDRKPTADGLTALPSNYDKVKPPALGPALPGDLGMSIVGREKNLGMSPTEPVKPTAEVEAARAEQMRFAQQAQQAREATVFFHTASTSAAPNVPVASANPENPNPLSPLSAAGNSDTRSGLDPAHDQNNQQRKLDFLGANDSKNDFNPHTLHTPQSQYEILAGTLISASLITGLDSDLPGLVIAQVTQDVRDSVSGKYLLIPAGSRLLGSYDSVVAFGQSRALVVWQRIIMPDGSSVDIDNLPGTDTEGYAGLSDSVDYHTWTLLKGVAISTLLGVGTQLSLGNEQSDLITALRQSTQDSVNQAGQQITQKNLDIQPTLKVRPGWPLRVIIHKDIDLKPYNG